MTVGSRQRQSRGVARNGCEVGDPYGPLGDAFLYIYGFVLLIPYEIAEVSLASDHLKPVVNKACLSTRDHCGFNDKDWLGQLRKISSGRPICYQQIKYCIN